MYKHQYLDRFPNFLAMRKIKESDKHLEAKLYLLYLLTMICKAKVSSKNIYMYLCFAFIARFKSHKKWPHLSTKLSIHGILKRVRERTAALPDNLSSNPMPSGSMISTILIKKFLLFSIFYSC